ncbi:hypothetical protein EDD29_5449 [Actinocorallia herbida]|uniref:DUF3311 domain-containing protein n=1 Tax=Actinocorallia herbida TaxID=58109 RepID=A0A3N1D2P6_9ACTN|nr:hypothetical protein [Actinocorallia herbida]ROO87807.1 hypothetical protein EDD29_5449 [Actinocorallia herbida]
MENRRDDRLSSRLVALAVLGFLLFSPPLLMIFDHGRLFLGVPLVWAYLLTCWAVLIVSIALLTSRRSQG